MSSRTNHVTSNKPTIGRLIKRAKILSGLKTEQDVIDNALRRYIELLEKSDTKKQKSFYEMTKHLAGSVEGPHDLSHGKKHMQGFGR